MENAPRPRDKASANEARVRRLDILRDSSAPPLLRENVGEPLIVGSVGRLAPQKGMSYLVKAAESVVGRLVEDDGLEDTAGIPRGTGGLEEGPGGRSERGPLESLTVRRVEFSVAGDGPLRGELEEEVCRRGLGACFGFVGGVRQAWDHLLTLDIFVMPSLWEGGPYVLLEAMAAGLPVIATDVWGVKDLIPGDAPDPEKPGDYVVHEHGIRVSPGDSDALAEAILVLARYPWIRRKMGLAARQRVLCSYTVEGMTQETLSVYAEALSR